MKEKKIFCIPAAGVSSYIFEPWKNKLIDTVTVYPLEWPGRGKRFPEKLLYNFHEIVDDIYSQVSEALEADISFSIFGYCMGATIAYELTKKIEANLNMTAEYVFFAAKNPPNIKIPEESIHKLGKKEFIESLIALGGSYKEIFLNPALAEIFYDIIKADCIASENYRATEVIKINSDIFVIHGTQDESTNHVKYWPDFTTKTCAFEEINGGHFFIESNLDKLLYIINQALSGNS